MKKEVNIHSKDRISVTLPQGLIDGMDDLVSEVKKSRQGYPLPTGDAGSKTRSSIIESLLQQHLAKEIKRVKEALAPGCDGMNLPPIPTD